MGPPLGLASSLLLLLLPALAGAAAGDPLGRWADGTAVAWGGPQDGKDPNQPSGGLVSGSCGYGELQQGRWPYWAVVAIGPAHPLAAAAGRHPLAGCGACLELQCDNARADYEGRCAPGAGSVVVQVVDTCTDCGADKISLPYLTMSQHLANPEKGLVAVKWRQVECAPPTNVTLDVDQFRATEGGYIRLALESVAGSGSITAIELRQSPVVREADGVLKMSGSSFKSMQNTYGARWELSGFPDPPLDVRITGDNGRTLIARRAIVQGGATGRFVTAVQFSTTKSKGSADAVSDPAAVLQASPQCNATIYSYLQASPDLSRLLSYMDKAGVGPMLRQAGDTLTLFAPINSAWDSLPASVDLTSQDTLQAVMLFLLAQGQVVLPDATDMLPDDLAAGGVRLTVDTLNGKSMGVVAQPDAIHLIDGSALTPNEPIVIPTNQLVCSSVVNRVSGWVPLPF